MREEYDATGDTSAAVITRLGRTGRSSCRPLASCSSRSPPASAPGTDSKVRDTALGPSILIDARIVWALLVPALVRLFGRWNWRLPRGLARVFFVETSPLARRDGTYATTEPTPPSVSTERGFRGQTNGHRGRMDDPYDLQRFVSAQDTHGTYDEALHELQRGFKQTHWMWFVFPQIAGLGRSPTAQRYALSGLPEAVAYLGHPVLRPRLLACARALMELDVRDADQVLGPIDGTKLRSSMTLFARAAPEEPLFGEVLEQYFDGEPDNATITRI